MQQTELRVEVKRRYGSQKALARLAEIHSPALSLFLKRPDLKSVIAQRVQEVFNRHSSRRCRE